MKKNTKHVVSSQFCSHRSWIPSLIDDRFEICFNCRALRAKDHVYVQPIKQCNNVVLQPSLFTDSPESSTQDAS